MTEPTLRWRKSPRSGQDTSCVELAHTRAAVRDSKNPNGAVLGNVSVPQLLLAVKSGRLGR